MDCHDHGIGGRGGLFLTGINGSSAVIVNSYKVGKRTRPFGPKSFSGLKARFGDSRSVAGSGNRLADSEDPDLLEPVEVMCLPGSGSLLRHRLRIVCANPAFHGQYDVSSHGDCHAPPVDLGVMKDHRSLEDTLAGMCIKKKQGVAAD